MTSGRLGALGAGFGRMGAGGGGASAPAFSISDIFGNGTYAGFDFTDLERTKVWGPSSLPLLYRDDINTAISASGQTVQIALDKSQGVALGAEKITNGTFATNSDWTAIDNGAGTSTIAGGLLTITAGSVNDRGRRKQQLSLTSGRLYRFTIDHAITSGNGGFLAISTGEPQAASGGSGTIIATATLTAGTKTYYFVAGATNWLLLSGNASGGTITWDNASIREVPGNHAQQGTSSARPAYTESGALRYLSADGTDDGLQATLVPGPEMTLVVGAQNAGAASGTDIIIGCSDAGPAARCQLGFVNGVASGGWGSQSVSTITDGSAVDLRGANASILLRANASVVELYVLTSGGGPRLAYQAAPSGTASTVQGLAWLANNAAGTLGSFFQGFGYRAAAVKRFIPDTMISPLMRATVLDVF